MACDGCTDVCNCVVQSGENVTVTGSGSLLDPYVVNSSLAETEFAASSPGGTIDITPGGTAGHEPELDVDVCAILQTGEVESTGQLFVVSEDADCKPHVLVDPAPGQVLGEVGGEAGWVDQLAASIPAGVRVGYCGDTAPTGWLLCDGSEVSRATYANLFAVIGEKYGVGDGATTFNLPDYRDRVPVGKGDMGGADAALIDNYATTTLGDTGGVDQHALSEAELAQHDHTSGSLSASVTGSGHDHGVRLSNDAAGDLPGGSNTVVVRGDAANFVGVSAAPVEDGGGTHTHTITGSTANAGSGNAHDNVQPFIAENVIIKV